MSKTEFKLNGTERFRQAQRLHDQLSIKPHFAMRMGSLHVGPGKWRILPKAVNELKRSPRALVDDDFAPDIAQKDVDMRIGLDLARLALCDRVRTVIVVTGDSDFVPALKFVRREGVKVFLDTMGHSVRPELKHHSDLVLS